MNDPRRIIAKQAPVAACSECGSTAPDRLCISAQDQSTCEHCLLEARKRHIGLAGGPYDLFVESLAAALDLREHETGLHSKRVALHTLILARQFYTDADELFAVIDTLDAMTFDRPYRKALPFDAARREIVARSGSQFDPRAVDAFLSVEETLREMASLESRLQERDDMRGG